MTETGCNDNRSKISLAMLASLVLVGLLKLLLIANQEIVALPHDPLNYVRQADHLGQYFGTGGTGYAIWLWLGNSFGVPQRIAIEIFWLVSAAFLAFSVVPHGYGRRWLVLPFFGAAAFAPQTYHLFDWTVTEGFYLCLSALVLGASIRVLRNDGLRKRAVPLVAMGLLIGLMTITRNEAAVLFGFLISWSVLVGVADWTRRRYSLARSCLGALGVFAVASLSAAMVPTAVALYNGWTYGVYSRNISVLPSHMKLLETLAAIETDEPHVRFVPITRKAREMAYAQSPTLARFRIVVESPQNIFYQYSQKALGHSGEIGAGWIWLVFNAAAPSLGITTYSELDATYRQAVREIEEGFASGKYRRRFVLHPFLGRDVAGWIPFLGEGFSHVTGQAFPPIRSMDDADLQPSELAVYDRVCMRRLSLDTTSIQIHGWVFAKNPKFPITGISAEDSPSPINAVRELNPRPDVQKDFQRNGYTPPIGMDFDIVRSVRKQKAEVLLSFFSGAEVIGRISRIDVGKVHTIAGAHGDIILGIDALSLNAPLDNNSARERIKTAFLDIVSSPTAWVAGLSLSVVCLLVLGFVWKSETGYLYLATAGVFSVWALIHLAFYSVLSAAAWDAEPRYLQNTSFFSYFFIVTLVLGIVDQVANILMARLRAESPLTPVT